jgi:hypothetical protein
MVRAIDWTHYDTLKAQGLADREIARRWSIPWGTFHREKQKREGPPAPVQRPVQTLDTGAVHSADTGADHCTALFPHVKAVRWNLWILDAIRDELAALAAERGISPSQLVQEFLWQVLSDLRSSTP